MRRNKPPTVVATAEMSDCYKDLDSPEKRLKAVIIAGTHGYYGFTSKICKILRDDTCDEIREEAVIALVSFLELDGLPKKNIREILLSLIHASSNDTVLQVREAAKSALGGLKESILTQVDESLRLRVIQVISDISDHIQ